MAVRSATVYRWAGAALLRASTDPGGLDLPEDLDLFGEDSAQRGLAWLSTLAEAAERYAAYLALPGPPRDDESWTPQSLTKGAAGIALLHIERAHIGCGTWQLERDWRAAAAPRPWWRRDGADP